MIRGALATAALAIIPLVAIAGDDGSASLAACAGMLRAAAELSVEPQRDKLLGMATLFDKAAQGASGSYGQAMGEMPQAPMPLTVDDCLLDQTQTP